MVGQHLPTDLFVVRASNDRADVKTVFDEGHLKDDPKEAQKIMHSLLSSMRVRASEISKSALVDFHDTVWDRIVKLSARQNTLMLVQVLMVIQNSSPGMHLIPALRWATSPLNRSNTYSRD